MSRFPCIRRYVVFGSLLLLVASAVFIHFRGKVRHWFARQLTDHSTFMAPYNALIYFFSKVANKPILNLEDFPDLKPLKDNWEQIREEALRPTRGTYSVIQQAQRSGVQHLFQTWAEAVLSQVV